MNNIKRFIAILVIAISMGSFMIKTPVAAKDNNATAAATATKADIDAQTCEGINLATGQTAGTACTDANGTNFGGIISSVINILSILVGAISVIMLIVGGFRYIISNGDASSTKAAKDTIMYALIGLIIVLFAQVIVRFVWTKANSSTDTSTPGAFIKPSITNSSLL